MMYTRNMQYWIQGFLNLYYAPLSQGQRPSRGAFVFYVHFCLLYILNILTMQQKNGSHFWTHGLLLHFIPSVLVTIYINDCTMPTNIITPNPSWSPPPLPSPPLLLLHVFYIDFKHQ